MPEPTRENAPSGNCWCDDRAEGACNHECDLIREVERLREDNSDLREMLGRAGAEAERLREERNRFAKDAEDWEAYAQQREAEVERLREAALAFLIETPITHPLIGDIGASAPAAIRYEEARRALGAMVRA